MTTATAARRSEAEPEAPVKPRKVRPIDPQMVWVQHRGHCWKEVLVRLSRDFALEDIKEPSLWSRVQMDRTKALQKLDRVTLVDHDEGRMYLCVVAAATPSAASLSKPQVIDLESRLPSQFSTAEHRVEWNDGAYRVVRKRDGHVLPGAYGDESFAIAAIGRLTPVKA